MLQSNEDRKDQITIDEPRLAVWALTVSIGSPFGSCVN